MVEKETAETHLEIELAKEDEASAIEVHFVE
jgi:hypothetical protein